MKEGLQRRTAISIRGLTRRYPDKTVGNSAIDLDVYEGDVLSVLGPNGAGKNAAATDNGRNEPYFGIYQDQGREPFAAASQCETIDGCHSPGGSAVFALNRPRASLFFRAFEGACQRQHRRVG